MTTQIEEEAWSPERHMDAIIREREWGTYDEAWDDEHIDELAEETIAFLAQKTGILTKHFRRDGLARLAQERIAAAREEAGS